jgi:hypothetical protein
MKSLLLATVLSRGAFPARSHSVYSVTQFRFYRFHHISDAQIIIIVRMEIKMNIWVFVISEINSKV